MNARKSSTEKIDRNLAIVRKKEELGEDITCEQLGNIFGITRQAVSVILRRYGIKYERYGADGKIE